MKAVGGSMIKGNRRLHILMNKEVVKLWANAQMGPLWLNPLILHGKPETQ